MPLLTVSYVYKYNDKSSLFFYFLLSFSISEILGGLGYLFYENMFFDELQYILGSLLNVIAYVLLALYIYQFIDIKKALKKIPLHILIIIILDIYCVVLVSNVSIDGMSQFIDVYGQNAYGVIDYIIEICYNIAIMSLLSISLINYLLNDSKKSMLLLVGSVCILFSEVIQVAYYYIEELLVFEILYLLALVAAIGIYYTQARLKQEPQQSKFNLIDKIEA